MGDQDNLKNDVVIYEKPLWYSGTKHEKRHQDVSLGSDQPPIHSDSPVPGMAETEGKQKFLSPSASSQGKTEQRVEDLVKQVQTKRFLEFWVHAI